MSAPSLEAARSLQSLTTKIDEDKKAISQMAAAQRALRGAIVPNKDAIQALTEKIKLQKDSLASTQGAYLALGGTFSAAGDGADLLASELDQLRDAGMALDDIPDAAGKATTALTATGNKAMTLSDRFAKLPGPLGDTFRKMRDVSSASGGVSIGMIGLAAGLVAVAAGLVLGTVAAAKFAFAQASAGRAGAGLTRDISTMKRDFSKLFSGINITPIVSGFHQISGMFAANTQSGMALREILADMFNPIFSAAGNTFPYIRSFFTGLIVGALEMETDVLNLETAYYRAFGPETQSNLTDTTSALQLGKFAIYSIAAGLGLVAIAIALVLSPLLLIAAASSALGYGLAWSVDHAIAMFAELPDALSYLGGEMRRIGGNVVDGMIDGIMGAIPRTFAAIRTLGTGMVRALRTLLGIHSPSRVFADLGLQIPRGVEVGIHAGASRANDAAKSIISVPTGIAEEQASAVPVAASARGNTVTISELHVHAESSDPRSLARSVREELTSILETIGSAVGVPA